MWRNRNDDARSRLARHDPHVHRRRCIRRAGNTFKCPQHDERERGVVRISTRIATATAAFIALSTGAHGQNYQELSAMVTGPWHHVPDARSTLEFNRERAKCEVISAQTPVDSTTPAVVQIVRWRVLINCLKAGGYEPGRAPTKTTLLNDIASKIATLRFDDYSCAEIARLRKTAPAITDMVFFTWAHGFISGWNSASDEKPALKVDPAEMQLDEQQKFIHAFCDENPSKLYLEGVFKLMAKLKYEKTRRTGNAE
jgi:hypothetical protein